MSRAASVAADAATLMLGQGLVGQCASDRKPVTLTALPQGYCRIVSGIGEASPVQATAWPLLSRKTLLGVFEFASFRALTTRENALLEDILKVAVMSLEILQRNPVADNPRLSRPTVIGGPKSTVGGAAAGSFFRDYNGCDVQGFDWAHSRFAPQSLVVIASVFSYYGFDLIANRGWKNATATIILGGFFFVVQLALAGDCSLPGEEPVGKLIQAILAGAEGLFMGGLSYSVVQAYYPARLPSTAISPFPKMSPGDLKDGKYDKDGNPWVCIGGVCYPDMSSAESRKAFAEMAAKSTGNGKAASAANCPAA